MTESMPEQAETAQDEARRWIARMASAEMTADELAMFKAWRAADPMHNRAFEEQRAIWRAAGNRLADTGTPRLRSHWRPQRRPRWPRYRQTARLPRPIVAAGTAAALVGATIFAPDMAIMMRADHRTGTTIESVTLPDGSRAMLNAGSAISLSYDDGERRIELLRGDVWFDVVHDDSRPFRVTALGGSTQDIGTAFEVRRGTDTVDVAVTEGTVEVKAAEGGSGLLLHASQQASYAKGRFIARHDAADPMAIAAWRQNEILLDKATIADAVEQIGRYRSAPVFVLGSSASHRRISGVFRVDRPDEAIDAVARLAGLSVYRLGSITVLRPES